MNLPALSRKVSFYLAMASVGLSLLLFNLPRYFEVKEVRSKIGSSVLELERVYKKYLDNKKALDLISGSLTNVKTFDDIKSIVPKDVEISKKGDKITIRGWMDSETFNRLMDFVMKSSNMAVYSLKVSNPNDSPFDLGERRFEKFEVEMVVANPEVGG